MEAEMRRIITLQQPQFYSVARTLSNEVSARASHASTNFIDDEAQEL